jgi:hypothetical protein
MRPFLRDVVEFSDGGGAVAMRRVLAARTSSEPPR